MDPVSGSGVKDGTKGDSTMRHIEDATEGNGLDTIEETSSGYFIWLVSITVGVGGCLFGESGLIRRFGGEGEALQLLILSTGYDTGIISAVLIVLNDDLGHTLDSKEKELVTSLTSRGAFIGALAAGCSADRYGRKRAIFMGCIVFVVGAVLQASAYSVAQMSAGRFIIGLGVVLQQ
jgi:Fucose permease